MAEFCLECWNRLNQTADGAEEFVISKQPDLCEGCGSWKPVIVTLRSKYRIRQWMCLRTQETPPGAQKE